MEMFGGGMNEIKWLNNLKIVYRRRRCARVEGQDDDCHLANEYNSVIHREKRE